MIITSGVFLLFGGLFELIFHLIERACIHVYAHNQKSNIRWATLPAEISAFLKLPILLLIVVYSSVQLMGNYDWVQLFFLYCALAAGKYLIGEYCKSL